MFTMKANIHAQKIDELSNPFIHMLMWQTDTGRTIGVNDLNILSQREFLKELLYISRGVILKTCGGISKYDVENGIFSRLQNNKILHSEKYELISNLREKMWSMTEGSIMSDDELVFLFT